MKNNFKYLLIKLLKSIFLSSLTFFFIALLNFIIKKYFYSMLSIGSYISFLAGGFINYFFYMKLVFPSYALLKRLILIYWLFVIIFSLIQSKIFLFFTNLISYKESYIPIVNTFLALCVCYPLSFLFMFYLSKYSLKITKNKLREPFK